MNGKEIGLRRLLAALIFVLGAASARAATEYTGDTIQGVPVISQLDVNDLAPGKKYRFLFQGIQMATGQHWYVPVMVAKGVSPGRKVLLGAGVHGDELSPTDVVQRAFAELDPSKMSGAVIAVFDISRPAMEFIQRKWPTNTFGGSLVDMNRVWPGNENGSITDRQAWLVWNRLFKERTLRFCCREFLGMGSLPYWRLLRLGRVRSALRHATSSTASVKEIAIRHGFRQLGRFAAVYRAVFDEPPSATLWRVPRTTQDANTQTQHRRSALGRG
jgi:AraC-like DNA-binding protein